MISGQFSTQELLQLHSCTHNCQEKSNSRFWSSLIWFINTISLESCQNPALTIVPLSKCELLHVLAALTCSSVFKSAQYYPKRNAELLTVHLFSPQTVMKNVPVQQVARKVPKNGKEREKVKLRMLSLACVEIGSITIGWWDCCIYL